MKYLLACFLALFVLSACAPNHSINNAEPFPKIGEAVPNISWTTISGEKIDLNQFKGSWVLLCYWCSCPRHRNEILSIQSVYDALYDKNLKVVVIDDTSIQSPITLEGFSKEHDLPFYMVADNQRSILKLPYQTKGRPVYFLIDTNGNLHATNLSFQSGEKDTDNVIKFLKDVIKINIENISVTNISANHATITWQTDKDASCWVEIKRQNQQSGSCTVEWTRGTTHKMNLDLNPHTTYVVNVVAHCLAYAFKTHDMASQYRYNRSKEYSFTTLTAPIISNVMVSKIMDKSAEISWETDKEGTGTVELSSYAIGGRSTVTVKEDVNFTKNHIIRLDNLVPSKAYYIDLKSADVIGGFDTYELVFSTQPSNYAVGIKVSNVTFTDVTDRSATLNWSTDKPTFCIISGVGRSYMEKRSGPPTSLYEPWATKPGVNHSWLFSELEPETEYTVQIEVPYDSETTVPFQSVSDVFNFKTLKATDKVDMK